MNIMINSFCNLHCPYCFAEDVINKYDSHNCMTNENFELCLQFLKSNNITNLRIIGGEPTLHPHIKELLDIAVDYGFTDILIFSNGLFSHDLAKYFKELGKRIHLSFLFNVNEPRLLKEKFNILKDNIAYLYGFCNFTLGINFYSPEQEWKYIIDLAEEYSCDEIRWALTIPNVSEVGPESFIQHLEANKKNLIEFFKAAANAHPNIHLHQDCNALPLCFFSGEEVKDILHAYSDLFNRTTCENCVIDVTPDLTVYKCFGFSSYKEEKKLYDFATEDEIHKYFQQKYNIYKITLLFNQCQNCLTYRRNNNSCACWKYRKVDGSYE